MKALFVAIAVMYLAIESTYACTEFVLRCQDASIIIGRTNMFRFDFKYDLRTEPKGTLHTGRKFPAESVCYKKKPRYWRSKTKNMYITANEDFLPEGVADGQNEDGLSVATLYFTNYAQYPNASEIPKGECGNAISHVQLSEYILTQFSKTQEIREAIKNNDFPFVWTEVVVLPDPEKPGEMMDYIGPLHWSVVDRSGDALVIEYTKEGRRIHDNTVGVFTNSPTYDWHMTNLKNYVNLQHAEHPTRTYDKIDGKGRETYERFGHGSGGIGVPGDFATTSRFVRTAILAQFGEKPEDAKRGAIKAWQILNASGVPNGSGGSPVRWALVKDLTNNVIYFQDQHYLSLRMVNLNRASTTSVRRFQINDDYLSGVLDVTDKMENHQKKDEL